jgi:hypothetical protein
MITFKDWFTFSAAAALLVCNSAAADGLTFSLTPLEIQPGERAVLEIRLPVSADALAEERPPLVQDELLGQASQFQVLEKDQRLENNTWIWTFALTSYKLGQWSVPPVAIEDGPSRYSTESRQLRVVTARQETDEQIREEFGPVSVPWQWRPWLLRVGAVILVALLGFAGYWLYRRRPKRKPKTVKAVLPAIPEEDPLVWLRAQLVVLHQKLESQEELTPVVDELTTVLREYYARLLKKRVTSWTTSEFRSRLRQDEKAQALSTLFSQCDVFKFSSPTKQNARDLARNCLEESERILIHVASR